MRIVKCDNGNIMMVLKEVEDLSSREIRVNSVDASFEKHVPSFKILGDKVEVFVNHVMDIDHYIEWIMVDYGNKQVISHFNPGDEPKVVVDYIEGMKAYSFCNKHGLWFSDEVK